MKRSTWLLLAALLLASCGHKGNLKTPSQETLEEQKKEKAAAKDALDQQKQQQKEQQEELQDVQTPVVIPSSATPVAPAGPVQGGVVPKSDNVR